jgi:hypothetical protein
MNSKSRWFATIVAITVTALAGLFLSNALARQRRVSSQATAPALAAETVAPAVTLPPATPIYVNGNFTFSTPQALIRPPVPQTSPCPSPPGICPAFKDQDVEPEIKTDLYGTVYVTAIHGYPGGVDLWKSTDKGGSFAYLGIPDGTQDACLVTNTCIGGLGGGDDSIDVSNGGYLYISSLLPSSVTMSVSYDGGIGGSVPGQKWEVNPASSGIPVNDRQWVAAYGPQTVYMTFDQAPVNTTIWFTKSTDAGKTWAAPTMLIPLTTLSRENNVAVDQYNGNIYTTYTPSGSPNQLHLLRSTDGGATWTNIIAYTGPGGTCLENAFPIIAVDKGGNLHVVFTQSTGCSARTNAHVYLISSPDAGASWTSPLQIDSGPGNNSTVMPYISAGSPGTVDVTWYGSTMTSPDNVPANSSEYWAVYFAQVTNALSANPTVAQSLVQASVHNLPICSRGGNCTGNTRDLAEYYTMTIDPDGKANIAYADELNYCAAHPATNCLAHTYYTKQTAGPSAYNPPAPPQPATFAVNLPMPNSANTAEPNSWVDSHNCIMGGSIGGPIDFISKDAGLTFTEHSVVVGTGFHGGDFDIKSMPNANGSRPDQIYTADLDNGSFHVHIGKSTDGGNTYFQPGAGGSAGEVEVDCDRMWLWSDRGVPTATDQTLYLMDHELSTEELRFIALTNDGAWSPFANGTTASELILPPTSTLPNTNPGPVFVDSNHTVFGIFAASTVTTNSMAPPFGKMPNVWDAVGAPPAAAGLPPGPFTNFPAFKGLIDSPAAQPSPAPSIPPSAATFGQHTGNLFPSGAVDKGGNVYAVWTTNAGRYNTVQSNNQPSTTFDVWLAISHDGGQNFYGPFRVSNGVGTCMQPWIAAGDAGRVDISWYQSTSVAPPLIADPSTPGALTGGSNNMPPSSTWQVMFAQSLNANSREPVFTVSTASDHVIHTGSISNGGLTGSLLGNLDRSLLDFFQVAIGPDGLGNIMCADNDSTGAGSTHINYMRQNSGPLALTNPSAVTCLPIPPLASVVSRMTHGTAGDFDVNLPLPTASPSPQPRGVECRSSTSLGAGKYELIFTFVNNLVSVANANVTGHNPANGTGTVCGTSMGPGLNQFTVLLCNVSDQQYITITLNNVADVAGNSGNVVSPQMGVLVGDVNASGRTDNGDAIVVRNLSGTVPADDTTARADVNASGRVDNGDAIVIRNNSGQALPSSP